jgi:hypothetical protein
MPILNFNREESRENQPTVPSIKIGESPKGKAGCVMECAADGMTERMTLTLAGAQVNLLSRESHGNKSSN